MKYEKLEMQNYLSTLDIDITNEERKAIFLIRNKMYFKIKTHFRNMYENTQCEGCKSEPLTTQHALECKSLIGKNELITYLPHYKDLYGEDEEEQVYIARIIRINLTLLSQVEEVSWSRVWKQELPEYRPMWAWKQCSAMLACIVLKTTIIIKKGLQEVGKKRCLNKVNKWKTKICKKNFFRHHDFTPFLSKSFQIRDHFFPSLFPQGFRKF